MVFKKLLFPLTFTLFILITLVNGVSDNFAIQKVLVKNLQYRVTPSETQPTLNQNAQENQKPLSYKEFGSYGWMVMHTFANNYPEEPTVEEKVSMQGFITSYINFMPCSGCRRHFQAYVEEHPLKLESNEEVQLWVCEAHNSVNVRLDKPEFECTLDNLNSLYKIGGGGKQKQEH